MLRRFSPRAIGRNVLVNSVIALALLIVVGLTVRAVTSGDTAAVSSQQTAAVDTGEVTATVSASGNVESARTANVSFEGSGGVVRAVYVKAGEQVSKGQRLAKVDQTAAQQGLRSALAQLSSAQASYVSTLQVSTPQEQARDQTSVTAAQQSISNAAVSLQAAQDTYALTKRQRNAAVATAERNLTEAVDARDRAKQTQQNDPSAEHKSALAQARVTVAAARSTLTAERNSRASALLSGRQQIESQRAGLTSAQTQLASTKASIAVSEQGPTDGAVASARAQVENAQVSVDQARTALADTVLRAPAKGTVASVSGVVGESSTSGASSSSAGASSSSADGSSSTTTSGFVTLTSAQLLEVTADVAEADIGDVEVGQAVVVTISANNQEVDATVVAVDTVETVTNNVVEYGVTVRLKNPKGVRLGQTSQIVISTGAKQGVLRASSSALTTIGGQTTATVQSDDGSTEVVVVETGLEGDSETEILSGLAEGDQLVIPQQSTSGTSITFPSGGLPRGVGGRG